MTWMLRNSRGKPDALLTIAVAGTAVVLGKVLLSGVVLPSGFAFGAIDSTLALAVLGSTLAPYTAKRTVGGKGDAP